MRFRVGGFQKFSLIDYPGYPCAIVFTQGCNFRCPFCHNPELVYPSKFSKPIPVDDVFAFLESRRGKLPAVSITGGEPTVQPDLIEFMKVLKEMGFRVKLDTNGSNPDIVEEILKLQLVDFIAMDIKAPWEKYNELAGVVVDVERIQRTKELIEESGIDYEFRTTFYRRLLSDADIEQIRSYVKDSKRYRVQEYRQVEK